MDFSSVLQTFSGLQADWVIIATFTLFASLDVVAYGARRECALALALPLAGGLFTMLSQAVVIGPWLGGLTWIYAQGCVFLALTFLIFFVINQLNFAEAGEFGRPLLAGLAGIALTAILIVVWLSIPALQTLWQFGPSVQALFAEQYRFFWLAGSFLVLAFTRS